MSTSINNLKNKSMNINQKISKLNQKINKISDLTLSLTFSINALKNKNDIFSLWRKNFFQLKKI